MPHKLRKIRKKRGSRTQGYGRVGQHRKSGSKGKRKVGRHKHLWSYVLSHEPDYFKKKGFVSPRSLKRRVRIINVGELADLAWKILQEKGLAEGETLKLNLKELGYNKLLGKGRINIPVHVNVESYSETAMKKIEAAGGKILAEE